MTTIDELYDPRFKNDKAFQDVSRKYVKLNQKDVKENNGILKDIVTTRIVQCMREIDSDFDDLFENVLYGGSYYKKLKVSKPDEYDLCLMINLCRSIDPDLLEIEPDEDAPTYVKIRVLDREFTGNEKFWLDMLNEDDYLDQNRFRGWMHSILTRALNKLSKDTLTNNGYIVKCRRSRYQISFRQSGPAFTLNLVRKRDSREIDFDLVPCLVFREHNLTGFRPHQGEKWIAIAKPLKNDDVQDKELLWRAGFYDDEKRLLAGQIKPIIRMVKKLRDVLQWDDLKSYFIETLFLHELEEPEFRYNYSGTSRTCILIYMLRQLQYQLESEEIPDYWNEQFNLLDRINSLQLTRMANELENIIDIVDDNIDNDDDILLKVFESKMKIK